MAGEPNASDPHTGTTVIPAAEATDRRRPALAVLLAAATLVVMAGAVIAPVISLIRDDLGLSPGEAGVVITAHSLLIAASAPVVGRLIDRLGAKPVLVVGLLGYGVFGIAGALAPTYPLLLGSRMAFGIAASGVINGMTVSLLSLWQGPARNAVMGYRAAATSAGGIVWPLIGGLLGALGWRAPFAVYLVALPIAAAAIRLLPATGPQSVRPADPRAGREIMRNPTLLWMYVLTFVVQLLLYGIIVFLPQRLAQLGITQPVLVAVFIAAVNLASAAAGLRYGRIRARTTYRSMFVIAFGISAAAFAILFLAAWPWLLLVGSLVFGPSLALVLAAVPARIGEAVPERVHGRAVSSMSSLLLLGQFCSPLLFGILVRPFGIPVVFLAGAAVSLVAAALTGALPRLTREDRPDEEPEAA